MSSFKPTVLSDLSFGVCGPVFILAHKPGTPDNHNWEQFLAAADAASKSGANCWLVYANDTAPTSAQRAGASAFHNSHGSRAAILTNSAVTRGVVAAIGWMTGSRTNAFRTTDLDGALNFLEIETGARKAVKEALSIATKALTVGSELAQVAAEP